MGGVLVAMIELDDYLIVAAIMSLITGVTMIYLPATFIAGGAALVGLVAWRRWKKRGGP